MPHLNEQDLVLLQRLNAHPVLRTRVEGLLGADVSDLSNSAESYARQQLGARGFRQVDARTGGQFDNSWWLNSATS